MLLVYKESTAGHAKLESGGKGYNLYRMSKENLPVPEWFIIGVSFFEEFKKINNLHKVFDEITNSTSNNPKAITEKIEELILKSPFPFEMENKLTEALQKNFKNKVVAVRSSAFDEDSANFSFAGQLSSFLYVRTQKNYLENIKRCWASAYSERGLTYRLQNKISVQNIKVAVVIQEMIMAEKSGVIFSCDPINHDARKIVINAVYGVGEGLVSGLLDADVYTLEKSTSKLVSKNIVSKNKMLIQDFENETCKEVDVEPSLQDKPVLNDSEQQTLLDLTQKIQNYYKTSQDIEWAKANDKFYILQSRPVTTMSGKEGHLYIWDNSNIVESYGGITLPLTYDFAHYVYHKVYVQFCQVLMVPQKHILEMDQYLSHMLGLFYGRVYYNLLNWYKLTSILPGYKYNRSFMETMMGTQHSLEDEIADRVRAPAFQDTLGAKFKKILTGFKFFYFHLNIQNIVDNFMDHFYKVYNVFRKRDYSEMEAHLIWADYKELEHRLLWHWKAPILNDFLCMIHYGIFKKLTSNWLSHLGDTFFNDLLAGNGNLESAEPTKRLIQLSGEVVATKGLKDLLFSTENNQLLETLNQSDYQEFYKKIQSYIDQFGFRCMSEMKLEQIDLHQDPSLVFVFLKNMIRAGQTNLDIYETREKSIRIEAEEKLRGQLTGIKNIIYRWSLHHARKAVRNRENTRFCRTRIYGVVRSMFYGIGNDFVKKGILEKQADVFFLTLPELEGALVATNSILELKKVIELRKAQYAEYEKKEPAPRFITRGPVYWNNNHFEFESSETKNEEEINLPPNALKGIGCCPGIIEGVAKLILSPDDNLELNGEILVTLRTDPGWIPLYPSAKGLLVERGGLLSHSAIVAREMGLPTVVSIKDLTKKIKTGDRIRFDGKTGIIEIL